MRPFEDPIFDPWSAGEAADPRPAEQVVAPADPPPRRAPEQGPPALARVLAATEATASAAPRPSPPVGTPEPLAVLRRLGTTRLEALARRLRLARHRASVQDLLGGPMRLIRFELRPWRSPLSPARSARPAVFELGVDAASDDLVTAWCWLDDVSEAPYRTVSTPAEKLTAAWIDRSALDFVAKALERG